jgi:predicted molibdopterin-dependent oxidoreductase YjgC
MIEAARDGSLKALYVLGASDFHAHSWGDSIRAAFEQLELLIAHDAFESPLTERADVVLPGALFTEKNGTLVNITGRPSRLTKGWDRPEGIQDDAVVLDALAQKMGKSFGYRDLDEVYAEMMRLINAACPLKAGELCDAGPGDEWPIRCLNVPTSRAQLNLGKFYTVCPTYLPVCRIVLGTKPLPAEAATGTQDSLLSTPHSALKRLRLVWSRILRGSDSLGDRSETMAPLRDPAWIEIHPDDAAQMGLADGDMAAIEADGILASGQVRVTANMAPGLVYVPQNRAMLRFPAPPADLPEVTVRKIESEQVGQ